MKYYIWHFSANHAMKNKKEKEVKATSSFQSGLFCFFSPHFAAYGNVHFAASH